MTSFISPGTWDFYFNISEWHIIPARTWTPALMLHLTNPCAKRKVLSLTKSKGKIYKTKSLGHYITLLFSLINHYRHINKLHLFWDSFEWFCLQISNDAKWFFLSCPRNCDRGLIVVIVYYFLIWNNNNNNKHNIIISKLCSHMDPLYIEISSI